VTESTESGEIGPDLVAKAQAGDPDALGELVSRAYPLVRRWALVRTGDPVDADDLAQDVLVLTIQRLDSYHGSARFTTWLYSVTRNAAADRLRRRERRLRAYRSVETRALLAPDPAPRPDTVGDRHRLRGVIGAFFHDLPPRQREVFDLAELQGLAANEIAARLGIEPVSVRAHLFKARRALRERILASHPELAEEWR
jgi:RNA polymerase sigma-70 factor (ECF subfamily)